MTAPVAPAVLLWAGHAVQVLAFPEDFLYEFAGQTLHFTAEELGASM
jgi:hypothetical protein